MKFEFDNLFEMRMIKQVRCKVCTFIAFETDKNVIPQEALENHLNNCNVIGMWKLIVRKEPREKDLISWIENRKVIKAKE